LAFTAGAKAPADESPAEQRLIAKLQAPQPRVRRAAARALARIAAFETLPALKAAESDEDVRVARAARTSGKAALRRLLRRGLFRGHKMGLSINQLLATAEIKEQVIEPLLDNPNIVIGASFDFVTPDGRTQRVVNVDLAGQARLDGDSVVLDAELIHKTSGVVLQRWQSVRGTTLLVSKLQRWIAIQTR